MRANASRSHSAANSGSAASSADSSSSWVLVPFGNLVGAVAIADMISQDLSHFKGRSGVLDSACLRPRAKRRDVVVSVKRQDHVDGARAPVERAPVAPALSRAQL